MTNVWWCNQGQCWSDERPAGLVCSAMAQTRAGDTFREMVVQARTGDSVVHYVSKPTMYKGSMIQGIVALSRALTNGSRWLPTDRSRYTFHGTGCWYGFEPTWFFATD